MATTPGSRTPTRSARRPPASRSATAQQQAGSIARPGGNANRAWDIDELLWDSHGNLDVLGRLATDRPHVVKLYGAYMRRSARSSAPSSTAAAARRSAPTSITGNQTHVFVERPRRHGADADADAHRPARLARAEARRRQEAAAARAERAERCSTRRRSRHIFNYLNRGAGAPRQSSSINLSNVDLRKGYDYNALINALGGRRQRLRPALRKADLFQPGTQGYFTVRFLF